MDSGTVRGKHKVAASVLRKKPETKGGDGGGKERCARVWLRHAQQQRAYATRLNHTYTYPYIHTHAFLYIHLSQDGRARTSQRKEVRLERSMIEMAPGSPPVSLIGIFVCMFIGGRFRFFVIGQIHEHSGLYTIRGPSAQTIKGRGWVIRHTR